MAPYAAATKSTSHLADELTKAGHQVSSVTVGRLLKAAGYSLQGNAKTVEGRQHPDRDAQFRYITTQVGAFQSTGDPVISVDAKKKELVGNFANNGAEWMPAGAPERVNVHDFADQELGKATPYGIYDVTANTGWVNVGTDADTGAFAVESIRRWWHTVGHAAYPGATRLLITADSGGCPTAAGCGSGRPNWPPWPPRAGWRSRWCTFLPAPPSGTGSSTASSATSR